MDPVTASGFAVDILTTVDYSAKILSVASEIRSRGNTFTSSDRLLVSDDLRACCLQLKALDTKPSFLHFKILLRRYLNGVNKSNELRMSI